MQTDVNPLEFIAALKKSAPIIPKVFTEGSCYHLCLILGTIFPEAEALYSHTDGHWITKIDHRYYDIHGEIDPEYAKSRDYAKADPVTHASAAVIHYDGPGGSYQKYKRSV